MDIVVFTNQKTVATHFKGFKNSKAFTLKFYPTDEMKIRIKNIGKDTFTYIDFSGFEPSSMNGTLKYLMKLTGYRYGIIDPKGMISDVALLFFHGASDYIGKGIFREGVTTHRIKKALQYNPLGEDVEPGTQNQSAPQAFIPSGRDWSCIRSGQEYTFCLMYVEFDHHEEMRRNLGSDRMASVLDSFKVFIEKFVSIINGRIWIWNKFNGLILFPFDGERCEAILTCFRLILYRKMICVEHLNFDTFFSYHLALHLGNIVYRRKGSTGTLVSNSINTIFHIGSKFAQPGNFYLTKEVLMLAPDKFKEYFLPAGTYEDLEIARMRLPQ
jgi:hypothetical protein